MARMVLHLSSRVKDRVRKLRRSTRDKGVAMLQKLLRIYATAGVIHVVLDNFKIHASRQVQSWLAEHGVRFRLHFLPPYCPDENKIERTWQDLHANVTRNHCCETIEELLKQATAWVVRRNRGLNKSQREKAA